MVSNPLRRFLCRSLIAACALPALLHAQAVPPNTANCLNADEAQLAALTNTYRQQNGLPALPVSFSLSSVAQWHVWDLRANDPVFGSCNLHSWSNARPALWQAMCYTANHAQAAQMWNKPRQITANAYNSEGYEIAAGGGGSITPAGALGLWQGSPGHDDVILNRNGWAGFPWGGMGVGLFQGYAVIWFGTLVDPLGSMSACGAGGGDTVFSDGFES
jgi:uncharacterized protein YkwD